MKKMLAMLVAAVLVTAGTAMAAGKAEAKADAKTDEGAATVKATDGVKMGYVDLNRCLNEVSEGKTAKAQLEADGKAKKQKLEIMQSELKKMKEDLDKQKLILSKEALGEKEQQFQQKFFELQKTSADFEKEFANKESNYIKPISMKLQKVIQQYGQTNGFTMIVPREMALYSLPGTDLTDKIISVYNTSK
ncbi:MAG: OmpH family outer membrane protein [bacterium]